MNSSLVLEGLSGENAAYYNTLHKGDSITINMNGEVGSFEILRKYKRGDKVKFVLRRIDVELPAERLAILGE